MQRTEWLPDIGIIDPRYISIQSDQHCIMHVLTRLLLVLAVEIVVGPYSFWTAV